MAGTIIDRVGAAFTAGIKAFKDAKFEPEMFDSQSEIWGDYESRMTRYALAQMYYQSTMYDKASSLAASLRTKYDLYRHIRPIYNPTTRQVRLLNDFAYGGRIDTETFRGGALPLKLGNDQLLEPLKRVVRWSRLGTSKGLFVTQLCRFGDSAFKVVDDPKNSKVRLEVLDPRKIRDVVFNDAGDVKTIIIQYVRTDDLIDEKTQMPIRSKPYVYTEIIQNVDGTVTFRTLKDNEPYAFLTDLDGNPLSEWESPYPFVPVVIGNFERVDNSFWGRNAYLLFREKIDTLAELGSMLVDQDRKTINPILLLKGAFGVNKLNLEVSEKDQIPYIRVPKGAEIGYLGKDMQAASTLENMGNLIKDLESDLPELALQRIREHGDLTAPGVYAGFGDAIARVEALQSNADEPFVRALQMAVSIGGIRKYDGFTAFNENSYDAGDMEIEGIERSVIPDTLSKKDRITFYTQLSSATTPIQKLALKEMGIDDKDIAAVVEETENQTRAAMRQLSDVMNSTGQDTNPTSPPNGSQPTEDVPDGETVPAST